MTSVLAAIPTTAARDSISQTSSLPMRFERATTSRLNTVTPITIRIAPKENPRASELLTEAESSASPTLARLVAIPVSADRVAALTGAVSGNDSDAAADGV